ncbi:MAG: peroxiredoxin [Thaumarchaeota archaeon]|nr:peroxiredoxin [Nitrososphaerota archaeon]MBI3023012.1 peroxiredoxin [Nitrososphaerota archaeon]MBI3116870.1 peroxiredoxin [Nitrososphaerota archaeon]MCS4540305.1 peroxiredoxin [Nitrososphaerota archaeon]
MVNVGERAPDVQLVDTDRKPVKISDFRGKKTVLAFFPGAFTGVCTKEMCTFRDGLSKFNDLGGNVVGISVDSPFSNKGFSETNRLSFRVLSDYSREAVRSYGIPLENFAGLKGYTAAKRSVFILDKDGTVRFKWVSDDPSIEPNYDQLLKELEKVA